MWIMSQIAGVTDMNPHLMIPSPVPIYGLKAEM
jgi:hypothetical protein